MKCTEERKQSVYLSMLAWNFLFHLVCFNPLIFSLSLSQLKKIVLLCSIHQDIIIRTLLCMGILGSPHLNQCIFWFFASSLWSEEDNSAETLFSQFRHPKNRLREKNNQPITTLLDTIFYFLFLGLRERQWLPSILPPLGHFLVSDFQEMVFHSSCWSMHLVHLPSTILTCLVLVLPTHLQNLTNTQKALLIHKLEIALNFHCLM